MRRMVQRGKSLATGVVLALLPLAVLASEGGAEGAEAGSPWGALGFKFLNFAILVGGLFYFLRKTVSQGLADRSRAVRQALEDARAAKEAADRKYREYKERVANLEQEIKVISDEFRAEGERQRERLVREAEASAVAIREQAQAAGANELKRAREELRGELGEMAVRLAEEILNRAYTADDQKKAVSQTIESIERVH